MAVVAVKNGDLEYRIAEGIAVPHASTTRKGGVSTGYLSGLNLGMHRGDAPETVQRNFAVLGAALGFDPHKVVLTKQKHTATVLTVGEKQWGAGLYGQENPVCDGLVTNVPGTVLTVFSADCTPVLLYDPVTGAVGAVHAGWRGTAAAIAAVAVEQMETACGCRPENLCAAIGPNIGACCFETDRDVPDAMLDSFGADAAPFIRSVGEKYYVNLKELNALALRRAGVTKIEISGECTACAPALYWSYRTMGDQRGSQGACIVCRGVSR